MNAARRLTQAQLQDLEREQMLDSARRRLETGTYGVCLSCHNPIAYGRLLAMPEATYCVACGAGA